MFAVSIRIVIIKHASETLALLVQGLLDLALSDFPPVICNLFPVTSSPLHPFCASTWRFLMVVVLYLRRFINLYPALFNFCVSIIFALLNYFFYWQFHSIAFKKTVSEKTKRFRSPAFRRNISVSKTSA